MKDKKLTLYFQWRYKNFRRPSGHRYYKIRGTEEYILKCTKRLETKKTHLQWIMNPSNDIKKQSELLTLSN